jgi:antagonist of KipI
MSEIRVQSAGLLTTVQDLGREGFGPLGISPSGAADAISLRIGNRLVGNAEGAAALEMTLLGGTFVFPQGAIFALTGSDFGAALDDALIPLWTSCEARPGQVLRVGPTQSGARCYLCVGGGIAVPLFLGSAATHLLSGLGGYEGRALRKGDALAIGPSHTPFRKRTVSPVALERLAPRRVLRVTAGPQSDWFSDTAQRAFYSSSYRIAEESNRMGLRLEGPPIAHTSAGDSSNGDPAAGEMITEGVALGAVQITAAGLPIILLVEQQTTGGYAKLANVITADFRSLGQLRPRDEIRFEQLAWDTARCLLVEQEKLLAPGDLIRES